MRKQLLAAALVSVAALVWVAFGATMALADGAHWPTSGSTNLTGLLDSGVCLEGATVDEFEACFAATDPTSDKTITFQNVTGTVYVSSGTDVAVADGGTGTSTGALESSGACAALTSGAVCCRDNNGVQCGFPTTDALADDLRIFGFSASPIGAGANLVGQDVVLAPGQGSMTLVATQANCGAGDTVSVVLDGVTTVCTRDAATDSATLFTCGASDAAMATNMAACLTQATGVAFCAGAGCTLFTGVAGTAYGYRATNEPGAGGISVATSGNHAVAANGTDGAFDVIGRITNSTAALNIGTTATTNRALVAGDVLVGGALEVNGVISLDGTTRSYGGVYIEDNVQMVMGTTGTDGLLQMHLSVTPDTFMMAPGDESRAIIVCENTDVGTDFTPCGGVACTNPTLIVQSADATTTTDNVRIFHDQTDGVIDTEGGDLLLKPAGLDVVITGKLATVIPTLISVDAATTFVVTGTVQAVDCVGAETITTATGGVSGQLLTMFFNTDADVCTLTDTAANTADTFGLSAAFASTTGDTISFIHNGTKWFETARAVN